MCDLPKGHRQEGSQNSNLHSLTPGPALLTTKPSIFPTHTLLFCQVVNSLREKRRDKDIFFSVPYVIQNIYFFKNSVLNVWINETSPHYILSISLPFLKKKCIRLHKISFLSIYKILKYLNNMNANRIIVKDIARKSLNSFICYKVT